MNRRFIKYLEHEEFQRDMYSFFPDYIAKAECECTVKGRVGMEVGLKRQHAIFGYLGSRLGKRNVDEDVFSTTPEKDGRIFGEWTSIKTGRSPASLKVSWKDDLIKAKEFVDSYDPVADLIIMLVKWGRMGKFSYIPLEVIQKVLFLLKKGFFVLPKEGTDPRGISYSAKAIRMMVEDSLSRTIPIFWEDYRYRYLGKTETNRFYMICEAHKPKFKLYDNKQYETNLFRAC